MFKVFHKLSVFKTLHTFCIFYCNLTFLLVENILDFQWYEDFLDKWYAIIYYLFKMFKTVIDWVKSSKYQRLKCHLGI